MNKLFMLQYSQRRLFFFSDNFCEILFFYRFLMCLFVFFPFKSVVKKILFKNHSKIIIKKEKRKRLKG